MPKRIVLCFDGTWNSPDNHHPEESQVETNPRRFFESVQEFPATQAADGWGQIKWYDEGVGTKWYDKTIGGAFGTGLDINILQGYKFLAGNYEVGDAVFVLGFSRGAYTARSFVGMIRNCGLIRRNVLNFQLSIAYGIYRTRDDGVDSTTAKLFRNMFSTEIKIKFVGVWDTVGALGIPLEALNDVNLAFYQFHDTQLSSIVENAYHAVAADEHRQHYDVCLWSPKERPSQTLEQRWFVGAHSDVGGGYPDRRLSDISLRWMQEKAQALGLKLDQNRVPQSLENNYLGKRTDSYLEFLKGIYAQRHPRHFRAIGQATFGNELIDESVRNRLRDDHDYKPQNKGLQ
jgi:uncharacterized protein (DUF2235 family)